MIYLPPRRGAVSYSAYFGHPGPPAFSDDSLVENVVIKDNFLDPQGVGSDASRPTGILLLAGNMGNSGNFIRGVEITGNEVSADAEYGVAIHAAAIDSSSYLPDPGAALRENAVEDVPVEGNILRTQMAAITMYAASGEYYLPAPGDPPLSGETGRPANIRILSNQLPDFQFEGISLFGGEGAGDNRVDGVRIEANTIASKDITKGVAFFVYGGGCSGRGVVSERNQITRLVIQGNQVACNSLLWLSGGMEELAADNLVEFYLAENGVTPAGAETGIVDSAAKERRGNRAVRLETEPAWDF
ncbi:MAG: hypothetical protein JW929_00470 [Anaerolineales bacterium]|nr:hypothetical protein [Anaerolineales bacterium]